MTDYQASIFEEGLAHHGFLEFSLLPNIGSLPGAELTQKPTPRVYETYAFSGKTLDTINSDLKPPQLHSFESIENSEGHSIPATQADLFIWIQSNQRDEVFARSLAWVAVLDGVALLTREEHGFLFRDSRDLTGFVDGSANPKGDARHPVALTQEGQHANGSFVLAQRWHHDLSKFHGLSIEDQEQVIGRTKKTSIELQGDDMPPNSHVSRTDIMRDNQPVKIYRRSTPTGNSRQPGLFFLAFSASLQRFQWLLESMLGLTDDRTHDRLLEYSKPLSSSYYFAPSSQALKQLFG